MFLRLFAGICWLCSLSVLAWAYWPLPVREASLPLALPVVSGEATITRQATLKFPARLRLGETGKISLSFLPTADEPAFNGYSLLADAVLELPGFEITSALRQQIALVADQSVRFEWLVTSLNAGQVDGIVPLSVQVYFEDSRPSEKELLSAQPCKIGVTSLFGLNIVVARLLGAVGSIGAIFLFLGASRFRKV